MGLNIKRRVLIREECLMKCEKCSIKYPEDDTFCPICGTKLTPHKTTIYANLGKNGITSYSYKLPDGTIINSKGNITVPIANGISYTTKSNNKKKK